MKKKIRKIGMLSSIALMVCLGVTGCYPDGKVSLEEKKKQIVTRLILMKMLRILKANWMRDYL